MVTVTRGLEITMEREGADGIRTPELAATWSRLRIAVDGEPVTLVSASDRSYREALYVSAYPLAEWVALNWWSLIHEPGDTGDRASWRFASPGSWHQRHNVRAANSGMIWPDVSLAAEGELIRVQWWPRTPDHFERGLRFMSRGDVLLERNEVRDALEDFVEHVIQQLLDERITGTVLQEEWEATRSLSPDEQYFATAAGRMGIDPFNTDDATSTALDELLDAYPRDLADEILDSADPTGDGLTQASHWVHEALQKVQAERAVRRVTRLEPVQNEIRIDPRQPWHAGFAAAREYREHIGANTGVTGELKALDLTHFASWHTAAGESGGISTLTTRVNGRVHVVEAESSYSTSRVWRRFTEARSLGLHLLAPARRDFVLTNASVPLQQASRSFAAELLAPGSEVVTLVNASGGPNPRVFDAIGDHLKVSTTLVERQYDNHARVRLY